MRFKIDWASLKVGSKFTVFAQLFYFVFKGIFPGAYIWRDDLTEGFLRYRLGRVNIWKGLYMEGLIFGILRYARNATHGKKCYLTQYNPGIKENVLTVQVRFFIYNRFE